ncbi:BglG family transcription antiterminator LicT [Dielma fastidiosa]|uniref:BglG family transcriptional antiterminator n=1 Tax=Dielma fastidiosa TaxID=1034346 RepID=A0A318LBG7_9FIRM|nr:PRD domain-containing protein [Dielma fastidiosa]MDY5167654.1 PRD domain-containing protein [Dielma fastidiosa]PXX79037.1 BglG family transcriptional antiterminator [Dielma fastidiosa]
MIIQRILTNNAVIIQNSNGKEQIVCGKGIGYKKHIGDKIDENIVNQVFVLTRNGLTKQLEELLYDIPIEYVQISNQIIEIAKLDLGRKLNESLLITLSDHLYQSISQFLDGVNLANAFLFDIKQFYEVEYEVGLKALALIEKKLKVKLPEAEAANIALHLVNAGNDDSTLEEIYTMTKIIQSITNIIRHYFSIEFDVKSAYYYRFIVHLKYFARRVLEHKQYHEDDLDLLEIVKTKYKNSYGCVCKIEEFMKKKYDYKLTDEEMQYLTIHIQRVVYKTIKD